VRKLGASVLLFWLLASPSGALELRRLGELRLGTGGMMEWLDPRGLVRLKNEWERTPAGGRRVTFVVADVRAQKLLRLPFDLESFAREHPSLFSGAPNAELVFFDGTAGLLRFDRREPSRTTSYFSVWEPETRVLSDPTPLGEVVFATVQGKKRIGRITYLLGPDPTGSRLYFAEATYDGEGPWPEGPTPGPLRIRFFRVGYPGLEQEWEMTLELPRRDRQLPAETYRAFSADGKRFALAEYYDRAAERGSRPVPPPQVYVLDLERSTVAKYPIPRTPYGLSFSRDGRYLAVGSHEEAVILRIDLEAGRVDRRVRTQPHLQGFVTSSSGDELLVMADQIGAPRSFEVRRWSDLSLRETIPPSRLFPGVAGVHPSAIRATSDGRFLVAPRFKADGYPDSADAGLVIFAIEEGRAKAGPDPTALLRAHVERSGLRLYTYQLARVGNAEGYFAPLVANGKGEGFAIGTRSDLPEGAPFQEGKAHPYAVWVDARGKVVWEKSLRVGKRFLDYEGGSAVAAPDGTFIAFMLCYVTPSSIPISRLVKLDRKGRVLWEWMSPPGAEARFPEELQLVGEEVVRMTGHLGSSRTPWAGELDAKTGRLLRDEVGAPP